MRRVDSPSPQSFQTRYAHVLSWLRVWAAQASACGFSSQIWASLARLRVCLFGVRDMRVSRDSRSRRPLLEAQAPAHGRGLLGALVAGTPKPALFLETQVSFSARRPCDLDAARTPGGYATSPQMWTSRPPAVSACPVGKCGIYPRAFITTREATVSLWACPLLDACLWVVIAERRVDSLLSPTRLTCAEVGKRAGRHDTLHARGVLCWTRTARWAYGLSSREGSPPSPTPPIVAAHRSGCIPPIFPSHITHLFQV